MHLPKRLMKKGSEPSMLHLTLLNLISGSITLGWKVIWKYWSSWGGR